MRCHGYVIGRVIGLWVDENHHGRIRHPLDVAQSDSKVQAPKQGDKGHGFASR
jgi:hypothetical protein